MDACKDLLLAVSDAERQGSSTDVLVIGKQLFPDEEAALNALRICKSNGWLMGSAKAVWLTPSGKRCIDTG
jgi:hypothetical protein